MLFLRVKLHLRTDWLRLEPLLVAALPPVMQLVNCLRGRPSDMMESITEGCLEPMVEGDAELCYCTIEPGPGFWKVLRLSAAETLKLCVTELQYSAL